MIFIKNVQFSKLQDLYFVTSLSLSLSRSLLFSDEKAGWTGSSVAGWTRYKIYRDNYALRQLIACIKDGRKIFQNKNLSEQKIFQPD